MRIGIESVAGYKDTWANIREALKGLRIVEKIDVVKDKIVRSAPLEPIFEAGNVYLVRDVQHKPFFDVSRELDLVINQHLVIEN